LDPYYYGPLWPDSVALAGLQARAMLDAGKITEADMAAIAHRNRTAAESNPHAQAKGSASPEELLAQPHLSDPLPVHDGPPVLAADDTARRWASRPAWIRGIDHRIDGHQLGARDLTEAPSIRLAGEKAGVADGTPDVAELHTPFTHQERIAVEALGLSDSVTI